MNEAAKTATIAVLVILACVVGGGIALIGVITVAIHLPFVTVPVIFIVLVAVIWYDIYKNERK